LIYLNIEIELQRRREKKYIDEKLSQKRRVSENIEE